MVIRFENVSKKFSSTITALNEVNLEIKGGEFVFVVGPSGAGKSTLLRLLAHEYLPTSGKIWVDETDITKLKSKDLLVYRRKLGYVFQDFKLRDNRPVLEN